MVNFLSYDADDVRRMVAIFGSRTEQYVHISSGLHLRQAGAAVPDQRVDAHRAERRCSSTPRPSGGRSWRCSRRYTEQGFPVTIVRPSHTYDDANPPVPGGWTVVDRIARGAEIPVHGDGTSLWTLTHAEDFAQGLVGLLGNPRTIGEVFNITGDDVYTWDQIYTIIAEALGVEAKLVHVASELFPVVAPDWFWSGEVLGDIGHTACSTPQDPAVRPGFAPKLTFHRAARRMVQWRADHPDTTGPRRGDRGRAGPHRRRLPRGPGGLRRPRPAAGGSRRLTNGPPPCPVGELGGTGLAVTPICFGTSPLASMAQLYGYAVEEEQAVATVSAAFAGPVNFLDTSNGYGEDGTAERRIGQAIRRAGGLPGGVVLATKVDPDPRTGDFSGDRVRASLEESMERLGIDRVALLHLHDPERITFAEGMAPGGPVEALVDLREQGLVEHLGVAGGPVEAPAVLRRHRRVRGRAEPQPVHPARPLRRAALRRRGRPRVSASSTRPPTAAACWPRARACSRSTRTALATTGSGRRRRRWRLRAVGTASRSRRRPCSSRCARR